MWTFIVSMALIGCVLAGGNKQPAPRQNMLTVGSYNECEGKDAGNYTLNAVFSNDQQCTFQSDITTSVSLIQCGANGQRVVNSLEILAQSFYPAGAYFQAEILYLALNGNLEGKFVYRKEIHLNLAYLKKCSSVLGYSYTTTKSGILLIADKLDMNVLISPTGGFEVFKRGCTTICKGVAYVV